MKRHASFLRCLQCGASQVATTRGGIALCHACAPPALKLKAPRVPVASPGEQAFLLAWRLYGGSAPAPIREHRFCRDRLWRFDFAWLDDLLAVEIDGGRWAPGGGRHASDGDREKLNRAAVLGWRILRFSPQQVEAAGRQCVLDVLDALGKRHGSGRGGTTE